MRKASKPFKSLVYKKLINLLIKKGQKQKIKQIIDKSLEVIKRDISRSFSYIFLKLFKKLRISISSNGFYYWLIRNNFPEGYQILCANCNIFKRFHPNWKGEKNVPD